MRVIEILAIKTFEIRDLLQLKTIETQMWNKFWKNSYSLKEINEFTREFIQILKMKFYCLLNFWCFCQFLIHFSLLLLLLLLLLHHDSVIGRHWSSVFLYEYKASKIVEHFIKGLWIRNWHEYMTITLCPLLSKWPIAVPVSFARG